MLKVQNTFEPTVRIKTQGEDAESALPDYMVDDENNDIASVSRADDNEETLIFDRYNDPIHIGATKIREDSEVVIGPDESTLVKGDDYILDPNIGRIALLQDGPNHSGLDAEYTISYDFKNTPRNIAETLAKIPVMGGASIYTYDVDQEFTGSSSGKEYTVFVEAVRKELDPNRPQEAEVSFDMREAVMIDFDQI